MIAPSFGDIFSSNAVNNGLLPARLSADAIAALGDANNAEIDLRQGTLTIGAHTVHFDLDETWRAKLMNGWDDIDLTLNHGEAIRSFRAQRAKAPGAFPRLSK